MKDFVSGERHASSVIDGTATFESATVRVTPTAIVVRGRDPSASFCVHRTIGDERDRVRAHLDLRLPVRGPDTVDVWLEDRDGLTFVGTSRWTREQERDGLFEQTYPIRDVHPSLDERLCPSPDAPIDGAALRTALEAADVDLVALAERLATSWLGPLPEAASAIDPRAPADLRRWIALSQRLATFSDHPWSCWPTGYAPGNDGIAWFQFEQQCGPAFGWLDGEVYARAWWKNDPPPAKRCAGSVGELAIQMVVFGLTGAARGLYLENGDATPLPLTAWPDWNEHGPIAWVGGPGVLGTRGTDGTFLRVTRASVIRPRSIPYGSRSARASR